MMILVGRVMRKKNPVFDHYNSFDELYRSLRGRLTAIEPTASTSQEEGKMKYKLNDIINTPSTFYVQQTSGVGRTRWGAIRLIPGEVYETDDKKLIESLSVRGYMKVPYNEKLEQTLKDHGKDYTVEICKSCGGRVKKIKYHAVEILE